jgi:Kef-type K+ transport system membrane component KefB
MFTRQTVWRGIVYAALMAIAKVLTGTWLFDFSRLTHQLSRKKRNTEKLTSSEKSTQLPALVLGAAMTARGEIGFLIASLGQSSGILDDKSSGANLYAITIWAVLGCTIIGPITVGLLGKKIRSKDSTRLGKWG